MSKQVLAWVIFTTSALAPCVSFAGWHDRKAEGWAWFEDKPLLQDTEEARAIDDRAVKDDFPYSKQLALERQQIEENLSKAILYPTTENVKDYLANQTRWVEQSALFSKVWAQLLLKYPELNHTSQKPVSHYGLHIYKQQLQEKKASTIRKLAQDHGLFFFAKGSCAYSQGFAKVVKAFSEKYHWVVIAVTLDGEPIAEYEHARKDNGAAEKFGIKETPALLVVNPLSQEVTPIAYGPVSLDQLENNLMRQFDREEPVLEDSSIQQFMSEKEVYAKD